VTPFETARDIVDSHVPENSGVRREALADAIRWAIIQAEIQARQPAELPASMAGTVVYRMLYWIDRYRSMVGSGPAELENLLREARADVCALHGIEVIERKPVRSAESSVRRKVARA
jgi:hypothetical protein